jgi:hypothetical protein
VYFIAKDSEEAMIDLERKLKQGKAQFTVTEESFFVKLSENFMLTKESTCE